MNLTTTQQREADDPPPPAPPEPSSMAFVPPEVQTDNNITVIVRARGKEFKAGP